MRSVMKSTSIQIRNQAILRDIHELAALTGKSIAETVVEAVHAELGLR
jgi:hypothetical protein